MSVIAWSLLALVEVAGTCSPPRHSSKYLPQNGREEVMAVVMGLNPAFITPVTTNLQPLPVDILFEVEETWPLLPVVIWEV